MNNKALLEQSKNVGCYYCCRIFESKEIKNFTDKGQTGICPFCNVDCLIADSLGFSIDELTLKKANKFWFGD